MDAPRLMKLLMAQAGKELSEDNDQDVNWLVMRGYLEWDDDAQTHRVTPAGRQMIHTAVAACKDYPENEQCGSI